MSHPLREKTLIARRLRQNSTDVERMFWRALRESLSSWKFRRQHPIGASVADFACPGAKLVIELDGGQHAEQIDADKARELEIAAHGYRVIRFWNNEILENLEGVLMTIRAALDETTPPLPTSPPQRGREEKK